MVKGLGIDIVENCRFSKFDEKFLKKIFTQREMDLCPNMNKSEYFASRFAAKEAFSKAIGTGFVSISPKDIEVLTNPEGAPFIERSEKINSIIKSDIVFLSISHEKTHSVAVVVLDGES